MNKSFSLTLNFGKEDGDLWDYLFPLSQEEREGIIKEALLKYVTPLATLSRTQQASQEEPTEGYSSVQLLNAPLQGSWGLEDLFVSSPPTDETSQDVSPAPASPLNHLFQLIGDEEDQEVLEFFRSNNEPKSFEGSEMDNNLSIGSKELVDIDESSQQVGFKGLDFVLNQVIGEEEDLDVLNFFHRRSKPE